jgi:hypothetical protein
VGASNMGMAGSARPTLLPVTADRPKADAQNQKLKNQNQKPKTKNQKLKTKN